MILLKMFLLQVMVASVVLVVLWILLEKELFLLVIERLIGLNPADVRDEREVTVLVARKIPVDLENRLRMVIKDKFPQAQMTMIINKEIWGGVVVQAGKVLIDSSLVNRLKWMWGGQRG